MTTPDRYEGLSFDPGVPYETWTDEEIAGYRAALEDPLVTAIITGQLWLSEDACDNAEAWIDTQPVDRLRQIINHETWVAPVELKEKATDASDEEVRRLMKEAMDFQDEAFLAFVFKMYDIPFSGEEKD